MQVTCLKLGSDVTLSTEKQDKLHFRKGETLMIMFEDEDVDDFYVCASGNGKPFVWVAKNSNHQKVEMELTEWQKSRKSTQ